VRRLLAAWWKIAGLAAVVGIGYFVYASCPCSLDIFRDFGDFGDWSLHISSLPGNCATFSVPARWIKPDDRVGERSDVQYYELRRSLESPEEFLIGMRGSPPSAPGTTPPVLYSVNKFSFRFHQPDSKGRARVDGVQPASEEQWVQAQMFLQFEKEREDVDPRMVTMPGPNEVLFNGRSFPKANVYSQLSSGRMASAHDIFIAVPSRSGPEIGGHGLTFSVIPDPWWRRETIEIFRFDTGARVARISGWMCVGGAGHVHLISWQGDELFTMPISRDEREVLVCRFNRR
jgi:hypothetical protein